MANWSSTHDVAYCFLCVGFMADGSMDDAEMEAIRGNVKVLFPQMPQPKFDAAMDEAVHRFLGIHGAEERTAQFDKSLAGVQQALPSADDKFRFIKNLAYIARADAKILDKEVALIERAIAGIGMKGQITLERKETSLFVNRA